MSNLLYWVWLQGALGPGSRKALSLARALDSPREVYRADEARLQSLKMLSERELRSLRSYPLEKARRVLEDCERDGLQVVTPQSPSYPERLREIPTRRSRCISKARCRGWTTRFASPSWAHARQPIMGVRRPNAFPCVCAAREL